MRTTIFGKDSKQCTLRRMTHTKKDDPKRKKREVKLQSTSDSEGDAYSVDRNANA